MASFRRGLSTFPVPMALHALNRQRLVERMRKAGCVKGVVLLQGAPSTMRFDSDHEPLVRQESFFQWAFGAKEPDLFGAIDVETGKSTLFVPKFPPEYSVWMGTIRPPEDFVAMYEVSECRYVNDLPSAFPAQTTLYRLHGKNSDSGSFAQPAHFEGINAFLVDDTFLFPHIVECRVIKTPMELELMRYVNRVSSDAHTKVMREVRAGMMEYQVEALFHFHCHFDGGCRHQAYTCICAAGMNGATLHYGHAGAPNDHQIKDGQMMLFDMGAEYHCYCSDITCSFPVNGKFTEDQKLIYNAVLAASQAVMKAMKPGVAWFDMHRLANKVICQCLRDGGLLQGSDEELAAHHIGALFMPHGLGHLMGLDTHDCGGYPEGIHRIMEPGIKSLRCGRVLEENMVLTVEPGIYFIPSVLLPAFEDETKSKYLNEKRIRAFLGFGGVRIEDDVIVTATGMECMTKVPRTVEEIEACMALPLNNIDLAMKHHYEHK